jgi:protoporphyrinogen oxidase
VSGAPGGRAADGGPVGTAVLGAGPAGLTAAYLLARRGERGVVFEADEIVGGLAKTVCVDGYRFDLGGHRFYTKLRPVERLWSEMLGDEFLLRPRLSRIYFRGRLFSYPLQAWDVLRGLGPREAARCVLSFAHARLRRPRRPESFEEWVTARFGRRLYDHFFRSYTEKVWGIPGSEIRAEWAAQRIRNLSVGEIVRAMAGRKRDVVTLIEEFHYPRLGPGQMWETFAARAAEGGVEVRLGHRCSALRHRAGRVESVVTEADGAVAEHTVDGVLSSIPLSELVLSLDPPPPPEVAAAARRLRYRDLCVVALMMDGPDPFPDNWIYLHDPGTQAGRVQNFGAWSEGMVPPGSTCLGVEYFCFAGDPIWTMPEPDAVALATRELAALGLVDPERVRAGARVLVPKAYPMYDDGYEEAREALRTYLGGFANLRTFGRNGLHRYNNQDHSMWTAVLATQALLGEPAPDVWAVNTEDAYLEEGPADGGNGLGDLLR